MFKLFKDDYPISSLDHDELNRRNFSESLAQAILNYDNEHCLIVSLMGKWGSGKTSIINMIEDYWNQSDSDNIIVHFNPWYFSNRNDLLFQFFDTLAHITEKVFNDNINSDNLKKLGKSLINMTSFSLNFGCGSVNIDPELNTELSDEETLLNLKKNISDEFGKLNKKVIIIIDDIDRLADSEIQQIFMLVKSLADFPNVVYILSFDKESIVGSLNKLNVYDPDLFLEKIIQIPIVIPEIRKSQLDNLVLNHLGEFYKKYHDEVDFEKDFLDIYSYLRLFFDNLRELYRYLNIINFYFSVIEDDVDIDDFMLILAIQLFETEIYYKIKENKDLFLGLGKNQRFSENIKCKEELGNIIDSHSKLSGTEIKKVLLKLFPKIEMYCKRDLIVNAVELKISNENHFENYFTLNLEGGDVNLDSMNDFFNLNDSDRISEIFLRYNRNYRTKELFDLIINRMDDILPVNAHYFINSLFDIGDLLEFPFTPFLHKKAYLSRIIDDLLKKYKDNYERFEILENAIADSKKSLYVAINLLSDQDSIYGRFGYENDNSDISKALIDEEDLEKLEEEMVLKIRQWDENGQLWFSSDLEGILYSWEDWDKDTDVFERVKEFTSSCRNLLIFAKGFRSITAASMHSGSLPEISNRFNLIAMLKYFDNIEDLRNHVHICSNESLTPEEKEVYEELLLQIEEEYVDLILI